jgi:fibrillarin-like rRNA methylase
VNLANVRQIEVKKDGKMEILQFKPVKSKVSNRRYSVVSNMTKDASKALNEIVSQNSLKFQEKLILKGTDDNTFNEWHDFLSKLTSEIKKKQETFQLV